MKKEIGPGAMAAAIVVVVVILLFLGYKTFGPKPQTTVNDMTDKQKNMRDSMIKSMSGPHTDMKTMTKDQVPNTAGK